MQTPQIRTELSPLEQKTLAPVRNANQPSTVTQARVTQRLLLDRMLRKKCTDRNLALLARAWCSVSETLRVWTGRPDPGALRPDLDAPQVMRAVKRARARGAVVDVQSAEATAKHWIDETEQRQPESALDGSKESLLGEGVTTGPTGGGGNRGGGDL